MKSIYDFSEIYLHRETVDGRKRIRGLAAIVQGAMGKSPFGGGLFAFTSRRRDMIRLIYWDRTGFALWEKLLEEEKFRWPLKMEGEVVTLTPQQLALLLDGFDITRLTPHATLEYTSLL